MVFNYLVLGIYIAMMVAIAVVTRNKSKTLNDFFLAGEGLGGWMSAFAYGTTYFSAVIFIGYAGKFGSAFGLGAVWIGIGNAFIGSMLAWKLLARRTKVMTTTLAAKTMPEFFEMRYESRHVKLLASVIIFVFLIPYSASIYQGLGYLFEIVFHIDFVWCVVIMSLVTALYLVFGGYFATALSDFVQGIIMLAGVAVMVGIFVSQPEVDLSVLFEEGKGIIPAAGEGGLLASPLFNVIILTLLTSFGVWGLPQSVHKFYAIRDTKSINKAMIVSTLFALIVGFGAYFTGALTNFFPGGTEEELVPNMIESLLPNGLKGLIVVLVLSASMSTLSSLALAGSSAIAVDFYKGCIKRDASDRAVNRFMKWLCFGFVVLSALLAIFRIDAIVTLMGLSWGTLAGCFIGPYVYGLYAKKATKASCYASLIGGLAVTLALVILLGALDPHGAGLGGIIKGGIAYSPLIGVAAMAFSVIIVPVVSAFTKKPSDELIEKLFHKE